MCGSADRGGGGRVGVGGSVSHRFTSRGGGGREEAVNDAGTAEAGRATQRSPEPRAGPGGWESATLWEGGCRCLHNPSGSGSSFSFRDRKHHL